MKPATPLAEVAYFPQQNYTYESPLGQPEALLWFFQDRDGKEQGPMPFRNLRECALKKELSSNMLVWREGKGPLSISAYRRTPPSLSAQP